jgi:hypothetical protein
LPEVGFTFLCVAFYTRGFWPCKNPFQKAEKCGFAEVFAIRPAERDDFDSFSPATPSTYELLAQELGKCFILQGFALAIIYYFN